MITKNRQSEETIRRMAASAFGDKTVASVRELTEGFCNVTYDISFTDGSASILKIAAKDRSGNTSNEIGLMKAETTAMRLVQAHDVCKAAEIQYYDTSRTVCDGDYFFMEKLPGENLMFAKERMTEEEIDAIDRETGALSRRLTGITNPSFGFMGEERRFASLYEFAELLLTNLLSDAEKREIDIVHSKEEILAAFHRDREAFSNVGPATLVHWDMWEGNIFVKDGHIAGVIDWERAMWGEAFMDDRFRFHNRKSEFLKGFGITSFTEAELTRLRWYDIILYLTMMIEVFYRGFEDKGQYFWAREMFEKVW